VTGLNEVPQLSEELVAQKQLLQMCPIGDGSPEPEKLKLIWNYMFNLEL
jgi:hypothetical protein